MMRLDLKIEDKSLKEIKRISSLVNQQGEFHSIKNGLFTIFARTLHIFFRVFPNFTVSPEGCLESPQHRKLELFLTLVNG